MWVAFTEKMMYCNVAVSYLIPLINATKHIKFDRGHDLHNISFAIVLQTGYTPRYCI